MKKRSFVLETEIEGDDGELTEVTIECIVHGRYIPARLYPNDLAHPAEYPEIEVLSVTDSNGAEVPYDEEDIVTLLEEQLDREEAPD